MHLQINYKNMEKTVIEKSMIQYKSIEQYAHISFDDVMNKVSQEIAELIEAKQSWNQEETYKEASDVLSRRTDAIIWHITPTSQECSIWYQDTHIKNMSVDQMLTILKKLVPESHINVKNSEGIFYENKSYKNDSTSPHN